MAMTAKHRVALVGCGDWGRHILRDLRALGAEVFVVARSAASRARAAEGGAAAIVPDVDALPEVAGAVVATSTTTHAEVIESLLPRGIPVFVEKPLCPDAEAAARLARLAPERLFVMDKWRYHPGVELLRDLARTGELGPTVGLATTRIGWGNTHDDADGIWHLAPHDLSIGLEILGHLPPPRAAVADVGCRGPEGLRALLGDRPWLAIEVSARSPERRREIVLHARDGVAVLGGGYDDHVALHRHPVDPASREAEVERRPIATEMPLLRELRAFVEHLGGGPPPRSSAAEAAAIVGTLA
jgi:predicted dehydrogenase